MSTLDRIEPNPNQIKQLLKIIEKHNLHMEDGE